METSTTLVLASRTPSEIRRDGRIVKSSRFPALLQPGPPIIKSQDLVA